MRSITSVIASTVITTTAVLLLVGTSIRDAAAQQYNPATQFSSVSNPSPATSPSVWSYGFKTSVAGAFTLFNATANLSNGSGSLFAWCNSGDSDLLPLVGANTGNTSWADGPTLVPAMQMVLHPGTLQGSGVAGFAVLRFTAPVTANYGLSATFTGQSLAGTTTDVHIVRNSSSLFDSTVVGFGAQTPYNGSSTVQLNAGDTLDYVVGSNGGFTNDATGVITTITQSDASAPEPCSIALMGLGLTGILGRGFRKQRKS